MTISLWLTTVIPIRLTPPPPAAPIPATKGPGEAQLLQDLGDAALKHKAQCFSSRCEKDSQGSSWG